MDEEKIVKLNTDKKIERDKVSENQQKKSLQTNPILQRMILATLKTKNMKFKFKDLFR